MIAFKRAVILAAIIANHAVVAYPRTVGLSRVVERRQISDEYDFIIVGGGTAGLTVADRLSEDPTKRVLVVERGPLDNRDDGILLPRPASGGPPRRYFYNMTSSPQRALGNRTFGIAAGHVVGGSSAVNGMFFDRGSPGDYDLWRDLGNPGWGWSDLLPYFKKSETFHPPTPEIERQFRLTYDMSVHGTDGPIHSSYPDFFLPSVPLWLKAFEEFGSTVPIDGTGNAIGAFWVSNSVDPATYTRSYARVEYYDPVQQRPNLHLLPNTAVVRVTFNGTEATGVEIQSGANSSRSVIRASREVIVSAGGPHTPQVLQLSGIGPSALLSRYNIPVVVNLPGVGQNYQNHPAFSTSGTWAAGRDPNPNTNNQTWLAEQRRIYTESGGLKGYFTSAISGSFAAFLPLAQVTRRHQEIHTLYANQLATDFLPAGTDPTIIKGWEVMREALLKASRAGTVALTEFAGGQRAGQSLVLEKPFSRGTINIRSADPYVEPLADYGALTNPADVEVLIESIKAWQGLLRTPTMQGLGSVATSPGPSTSDATLRTMLRSQTTPDIGHSTSTASMLPREHGGVVGPQLLVYGTTKLSIADNSIMPLIPSTHTSSSAYAIGEKAADLIKARHAG